MINNTPTYISLFSSAGVGCYGFKLVGFECIATNELLAKRIQIQQLNHKCKYPSGYLTGSIQDPQIKQALFDQIKFWQEQGNDRVDVIIATPPCQGMSVANHKKSDHEIERNSLVCDSVSLIKAIKPRFFVLENVPAFWKTGCIDHKQQVKAIGQMIIDELAEFYNIHHQVINFKDFGNNSSRTRTLVIGVSKELAEQISPLELMPDYAPAKTLGQVIGDLKSLTWGEIDQQDFYHNFKTYASHMRPWISSLKPGQSAFENEKLELKPHKLVNGQIIVHQSKNSDKYKRQSFDKVAPCIHTRNDILSSQNTVHPMDDRVFSIRELMRMMTIPHSFKWVEDDIDTLNQLSLEQKQARMKKIESNIRQCIGEAVPTVILEQVARKIFTFCRQQQLSLSQINNLIVTQQLDQPANLLAFVKSQSKYYTHSTIASLIELANSKRAEHSAYFTNKSLVNQIVTELPDFANNKNLTILEPAVGSGNFLPLLFSKYSHIPKVKLIVMDIDPNAITLLKVLYAKTKIPANFTIKFVCGDYLSSDNSFLSKSDKLLSKPIDLVIGNPPFTKVSGAYRKQLLVNSCNQQATNLAAFFLEKALTMAQYVSFVLPKNLLNTPEYALTRKLLAKLQVDSIIDFGEKGFKGVLIETINLMVANKPTSSHSSTKIVNTTFNTSLIQSSSYIFDSNLPYWVIYRSDFFDRVMAKMQFGVFDVFRDRQITNSNSTIMINPDNHAVRVIKSRNILEQGKIIDIDQYDAFIDPKTLQQLEVHKFLNRNDVYLTPNMSYKPRLIKKTGEFVVNGSVAILIPKDPKLSLSTKQLDYIASDEFRSFYKIARNYQTRSLNIDKTSSYWFGVLI